MQVHSSIFRAYDVRGIVERELTPELAFHLGRAIGSTMQRRGLKAAAIGRDCRESGQWLATHLTQGLNACGVDVLDVGVVPTPVQYFAMYHLPVQGGVQITGSHNPPEYNGFKITIGGETLHTDQIQALLKLIQSEDYVNGSGSVTHLDINEAYRQRLLSDTRMTPGKRPLKVVVDAGNGTAGVLAPQIYRALGCEVVELYCDMDARFPNHHPDPTVEENMRDLQAAVLKHGADIGIAFDGDGDRIGVVDERGALVWGDRLMIVLARALLKEAPGATIIGEVKCSQTLFDDVTRQGGVPIMWKAGHSFIKAKMRETGALLAGEMSGHIFFKHRYYGFDDATYAGLRLLEIVSAQHRPLSELWADVPTTYSTPEIRVDCSDERKFQAVEALKASLQGLHPMNDIDGVRIQFDGGWGLVRASNTQPILVLRFEAQDEARLAQIRQEVEKALQKVL